MSLKNWSTTAASNTSAPPNGAPENTTTLADMNDIMRQIMADVRTLAASDTIASATTCDLGSKDATFLTVSGTTTITGLGTVSAGIYKVVTFSGALTLTHNATSLILPGAANISTVAGHTAIFLSLGSGNWRCMAYQGIGVVVAPSFLNSWVNYGSPYVTAGYWKDVDGIIHLQGLIKSGTTTSGTPLFALPSGCRPLATHTFPALSNGALITVVVDAAGSCYIGDGTNASSSYLSLEGISFRTT